jgi:hypothetical protein
MERIRVSLAVSCFLLLNSAAAVASPATAASIDDPKARIERLEDAVLAPLAMGFGFWLLRRWRAKPVPDGILSTDTAFAELPDLDEED